MPLADNWGAETSPSGYELQYAAEVGDVSPSWADYIRQAGDVIGGIQSVLNQVTLTEIERQRLQAQLDRARAGQPPLPPAVGPGARPAVNWQWIGLGALALGAVFMLTRRR